MPTPPATIRAPLVEPEVGVVLEITTMLVVVTLPPVADRFKSPDELATLAAPNPTVTAPPTYKSPLIPAPPATCKAPVNVDVAAVVLVTVVIPPTTNPRPIPTPPCTCKAPEFVEAVGVTLLTYTIPAKVDVPVILGVVMLRFVALTVVAVSMAAVTPCKLLCPPTHILLVIVRALPGPVTCTTENVAVVPCMVSRPTPSR